MTFTPKQARLIKELTQNNVAEKMGVSVHVYRKLESDPSRFTIGQAKIFSEVVGFSYEQISF